MRLATRAPAKLNLCLYVGPRRADGLHEICSLFQPITLADEVMLEQAAVRQPTRSSAPASRGRTSPRAALARVSRALRLGRPPVRITIEKHIPVAAGLGGGSADAAAVLRLAAQRRASGRAAAELAELAMSLGADVPSQLEPRPALVDRRGRARRAARGARR